MIQTREPMVPARRWRSSDLDVLFWSLLPKVILPILQWAMLGAALGVIVSALVFG